MRITKEGLIYLVLCCQLLVSLFIFGCNPNTINFAKMAKPAAVAAPSPVISNIQVVNNQIVITGTNLAAIDMFSIKEGVTTTPMAIESQSNTSIIANTISNVNFAAGKVFDFVFSNAYGASSFTVNFSLCNSDLNGKGFNCSITPNDKDVLSYDANTNKWVPRNVNGLSYKGTFSAAGGSDPGGTPGNGDYYIISAGGTINSVTYSIGDWIVYNSDDSVWQKVSNSKDVLSVFGRTGKVSAKEGDYNLDKLSDVDLTTTSPVANNVLKFNGTQWVPSTATMTETDPTVAAFAKTTPPNCSTGQVLKSNGTSLSCVADGSYTGTANKVVTTDATGKLTTSTISDSTLGYLSGVTSNVQTQLNLKADASSVVDYSVSGTPLVHPTRVYGGTAQANKILVTDGAGAITTSSVTPTELSYLSGATSNIQSQINTLSGNGQWLKTGSDLGYAGGKVGVGTTTPATSLDVTGEVKVGNTSIVCSSTTKGSIRYNSTSNVLEFCNGTGWNLVQAAACSDAAPDVFSFTNQVNATTSTLYTSNIIQVTGINCLIPVTISGSGSPQYQVCSDSSCSSVLQSWTSSPSNIASGQYIQARLTTDNVGGSSFKATILIGSGATVWTVTTAGNCVGSPAPGTICADGSVYVGLSPDGNIPMYTTRCDGGMTWDGATCTGSRLLTTWSNGNTTQVASNINNITTGKANSAALYALTGSQAPYLAAQYCETLVENGYSDWYLPARSELLVVAANNTVISNWTTGDYWTSTEYVSPNTHAWVVSISTQAIDYWRQTLTYKVRCVRR